MKADRIKMKKKLKPKPKHSRPSGRLLLYFKKDVGQALAVITEVASGNMSEAIRRAILDAAERIRLQKSMENIDRGVRIDQSLPREVQQ